jgi:hypothetical protein
VVPRQSRAFTYMIITYAVPREQKIADENGYLLLEIIT